MQVKFKVWKKQNAAQGQNQEENARIMYPPDLNHVLYNHDVLKGQEQQLSPTKVAALLIPLGCGGVTGLMKGSLNYYKSLLSRQKDVRSRWQTLTL